MQKPTKVIRLETRVASVALTRLAQTLVVKLASVVEMLLVRKERRAKMQ